MAAKQNHSKAVIDEAGKAGLDIASTLIPDFGKARDIVSAVDHTSNALYHGKEAVRQAINHKTNQLKRAIYGVKPKKTRTHKPTKRQACSRKTSTTKKRVSFTSHGKRVSFYAKSPSKKRR